MKKFIAVYRETETDQNKYELLMIVRQSAIAEDIDLEVFMYRCQNDPYYKLTDSDELEFASMVKESETESWEKIKPVNWNTES